MSKELNRLYNRAVKKGEAVSKVYTDYYGNKLYEPEEKYRVDVYKHNGAEITDLYHYGTPTLSVENKSGKYTITDLYGQSVSDRDSIMCILSLVTKSEYSPLGLTFRDTKGGFGLVDNNFNYYMQDDYKNKQDFIDKANELLKA